MALNRLRSRGGDSFPPQFAYWDQLTSDSRPGGQDQYSVDAGQYTTSSPDYSLESIHDESGIKTSGSVRPVIHEKTECSFQGTTPYFKPRIDGPFTTQYIPKGQLLVPGLPTFIMSDFPSTDATVASFNQRAARAVTQQIPQQMSVPNFLWELRDVKETLSGMTTLFETGYKKWSEVVSGFSRYRPRANDVKFKDVNVLNPANLASTAWLTFNFGIRPVWADVKNTLSYSLAVEKRIAHLKRTYGKRTKFRKKPWKFELSSTPSPWTDYAGIANTRVQYRDVRKRVGILNAGGYFIQKLGGLEDVDRQNKAYLAALGFHNLYTAAWDSVPFTWLADYFLNIGELLENLQSNDVFEGEITLEDTWSSSKIITTVDREVRFETASGWTQPGVCTSLVHTLYERTVGIPTNLGLVFGTRVGPTQIANIAAVLT